jgi:hypothetical protein
MMIYQILIELISLLLNLAISTLLWELLCRLLFSITLSWSLEYMSIRTCGSMIIGSLLAIKDIDWGKDSFFTNIFGLLLWPLIILVSAMIVIALGFLSGFIMTFFTKHLSVIDISLLTLGFVFSTAIIASIFGRKYIQVEYLYEQMKKPGLGINEIEWYLLDDYMVPFLANGLFFGIGLIIASLL